MALIHIGHLRVICLEHVCPDWRWFFTISAMAWNETIHKMNKCQYLHLIHNLCVNYAHAAANLNWWYSNYAKSSGMNYFCTTALWTPRTVQMHARASCRVDSRTCRVYSFAAQVIKILFVIFNDIFNLVNWLIYHKLKDKVCLCHV